MILETLAAVFVLVAVAAGTTLVARALLRGPVQSAIRCGCCGAPADSLTSFTCQVCGHDVRDVGLRAAVARSPAARFYKAIAVTLVVMLLAPMSVELLRGIVPQTRYSHASQSMYPSGFGGFEAIELDCKMAESGGEVSGRMIADLSMPTGRMHSMEIAIPTRKCWTIDEYGQRREREMFSELVLREWMKEAGVDDGDKAVSDGISQLHQEMQHVMSESDGPAPRGMRPSFSGGSSNSSSTQPAQWLRPVVMMFWAAFWLIALAWTMRDRALPPATVEAAA